MATALRVSLEIKMSASTLAAYGTRNKANEIQHWGSSPSQGPCSGPFFKGAVLNWGPKKGP